MKCPQCGSKDVVWVRFGYPPIYTPEEQAYVDASGEIEEGGDLGVPVDRMCKRCGHRWLSRKTKAKP